MRDSRPRASPPAQVLITNGGKQAVYQAFATLIDPGDEVILPAPYWTTYPESITLAGGVPVVVTTGPRRRLPAVGRAARGRPHPRTKALLWCSPSNPTGAVASPELTEAVGRWAVEHGVWVVTDEIYEHLVYDGAERSRCRSRFRSSRTRCVVLNGVAKTYAMTGWRVGWMVGSRGRGQARRRTCRATSARTCATWPSAPRWRPSPGRWTRSRRCARRSTGVGARSSNCSPRSRACSARPRAGRSTPTRPSRSCSARELRGTRIDDTVGLAAAILEHAEVAVVPGEAFGTPGFLRHVLRPGRRRPAHGRRADGRAARRGEVAADVGSDGETDAGCRRAAEHRLPVHRGRDRHGGDAVVTLVVDALTVPVTSSATPSSSSGTTTGRVKRTP